MPSPTNNTRASLPSALLASGQTGPTVNALPVSLPAVPLPDPKKAEESLKQLRVFVIALIVSPVLALLSHRGLSSLAESGALLKACQALDKLAAPLNQRLKAEEQKITAPYLKKLFGLLPESDVARQSIADPVNGLLTWARQQLPKAQFDHWTEHLGNLKTFDEVTPVIEALQKALAGPEVVLKPGLKNHATAMLDGLKLRLITGVQPRYWHPYAQAQELVRQGNLQPIGRSLLHLFQATRQLFSGEFAFQLLGQKPGLTTVLWNGLVTIGFAVGALLGAEQGEKIKKFADEFLGTAAGNFAGWYWGTQLLGHGDWITKGLNKFKPGLATEKLLMGTWSGVLTELVAIFALGRVFETLGRGIANGIFGKPRDLYEPKLPTGYQPLNKRSFFSSSIGPETQAVLAELPKKDIIKLMANSNEVKERRDADKLGKAWDGTRHWSTG